MGRRFATWAGRVLRSPSITCFGAGWRWGGGEVWEGGGNRPPPPRLLMDLGLRGQTALVAAASRGLGKAVAKLFVEEGARVAICSRRKEAVEAAAADIGGGWAAGGRRRPQTQKEESGVGEPGGQDVRGWVILWQS